MFAIDKITEKKPRTFLLRCYIWKLTWIKLIQAECVTGRARPWEIYGNPRLTYPHTKSNGPIILVRSFKCLTLCLFPSYLLWWSDLKICGDGSTNQIRSPCLWCCLRRLLSVPQFSVQPSQAVVVVEDAFLDGKMSVSAAVWLIHAGVGISPKVQTKCAYNYDICIDLV